MFVIRTPEGFFADVTAFKSLFTPEIEGAEKYKYDFWAKRVVDVCILKDAEIIEVGEGENAN